MTVDVCKEAKAARGAVAPLGWAYLGGGPYPFAPVMRFRDDVGRVLEITVAVKERD